MMIWEMAQIITPRKIALYRPILVSAIQAPKIGTMYARKVKSVPIADAACKPRFLNDESEERTASGNQITICLVVHEDPYSAPAESLGLFGLIAPVPGPPFGRGNCM